MSNVILVSRPDCTIISPKNHLTLTGNHQHTLPLGSAQELPPKQRAEGPAVAPLCPTTTSTGNSSQHLQKDGPREQRNLLPEHFHFRHHIQLYLWLKPCPWGQARALKQRRKQEWWFHKPCFTPIFFGTAQDVHLSWPLFLSASSLKTTDQILFPFWWILKRY